MLGQVGEEMGRRRRRALLTQPTDLLVVIICKRAKKNGKDEIIIFGRKERAKCVMGQMSAEKDDCSRRAEYDEIYI